MNRLPGVLLWIVGMVFLFSGVAVSAELEIDRISKEQLQQKMVDNSVVVVDVRSGRDWKSSEFKIKGAIRQGGDIVSWAKSYDKDTVFVLYCA